MALSVMIWLFFVMPAPLHAQETLLLNGDFEDVNTCTEYNAECGVEAWFYLRDIKAQMLSNDSQVKMLGNNSFAIYFPWRGYIGFHPVIGTIIPCGLRQGVKYSFSGIIQAKLNNRLTLNPAVVVGEKYYVPRRPFSAQLQLQNITQIKKIPDSDFYEFEYSFVATGREKYLTFGAVIEKDTVGAKRAITGDLTVSLVMDNFKLISSDDKETACEDFSLNKKNIYAYNARHKDMDYALFGKGDLPINFNETSPDHFTRIREKPVQKPLLKIDTLSLGDIFFDFNKAVLKKTGVNKLQAYFIQERDSTSILSIDSIYIDGHTDSIGTESQNLALSSLRCKSIESWLTENGIVSADRLVIRPFGKTKPIASNSTAEGRARNRRVEIIIYRKRIEDL